MKLKNLFFQQHIRSSRKLHYVFSSALQLDWSKGERKEGWG